jgi:xanthine/uracil permease
MGTPQLVFSIVVDAPGSWSADWAWGLPLIVLTVVIHVLGLGLIGVKATDLSSRASERRHPAVAFVMVLGATTLLATCLHALEAGMWAEAYRLLNALPDDRTAMLYSLSAITSYGHATLTLKEHWQLMGAMEALNGWLLFGLTTAFLFAMVERVWSSGRKPGRP